MESHRLGFGARAVVDDRRAALVAAAHRLVVRARAVVLARHARAVVAAHVALGEPGHSNGNSTGGACSACYTTDPWRANDNNFYSIEHDLRRP